MKSKRCTRHAMNRAHERYGALLDEATQIAIRRKIRKALKVSRGVSTGSDAAHPETCPRRVNIANWIVPVAGIVWRVTYDKVRDRIITVLPPRERAA